jgi:hypothetical protein
MANGIMDTLTNIRTTGQGVPMSDPSMMAGAGGPPMGGPPPVDPSMMIDPSMMAGAGGPPPVDPSMMAGAGGPPMGGPEGEGVSIEGDAAMLAETVVGRTQGDVGAAVAILETATAMLTQGAGAEGPIMANKGRYLYRDNGGDISDNDILKQMIMDNLNTNQNFAEQLSLEGGENLSDLVRLAAAANSQEGREITDEDLAFHLKMLEGKGLANGGYMSQEDAMQDLMRHRSS